MKKAKRTKSGNVRLPMQTLQIAPRPDYLLDYQDCSNEELRSFLTVRGGQNPKKQVRIQLIRTLAQMDRDATIPFLDLLPEVRNMVYTELLSRNHERGKLTRRAYPNILRTSKQVYNEAAGIFLAESTAIIEAYFEGYDGEPSRPLDAYAQFVGCVDFYVHRRTFVNLDIQSLSCLSKVQNLYIGLVVSNQGIVTGPWPEVSSGIGMLAQTFRGLVKLSIEVEDQLDDRFGPQGKREQMANVLAPLSRFSDTVTVDIRGLDQDTYDAVWKRINSS